MCKQGSVRQGYAGKGAQASKGKARNQAAGVGKVESRKGKVARQRCAGRQGKRGSKARAKAGKKAGSVQGRWGQGQEKEGVPNCKARQGTWGVCAGQTRSCKGRQARQATRGKQAGI